ncbi:unnamed protein product, partial [Meganyctiphanes norvegica]
MSPSTTLYLKKFGLQVAVILCRNKQKLVYIRSISKHCVIESLYYFCSIDCCRVKCHYDNDVLHNVFVKGIMSSKLWAALFSPDRQMTINLFRCPQTLYLNYQRSPIKRHMHICDLLPAVSVVPCQRHSYSVDTRNNGICTSVHSPRGLEPKTIISDIKVISESKRCVCTSQMLYDKKLIVPLAITRIVNNVSWYKNVSVIDFLRDAGRHCRLGAMLSRTSVQTRLNTDDGMSFTEFTYQVAQSYDWMHLFDKYNCTIQIGGSDQMGNIVSGHDLISRARDKQVTGLTVPLITTSTGDKFGKSAGNAIWLDATKTSTFDFYQFFLRVTDAEVEKFLCLFTFYPVSDVKKIMDKHMEKPETRHAQKKLAEKVTLLVHGREGLDTALRTTSALYGNRPEALAELSSKELIEAFKGASQTSLLLQPGTTILSMALQANCFSNERDGRRIIEAGGFYVNHARVNNPDLVLIPGAHILTNGITLARVGKKNYYLVKWN